MDFCFGLFKILFFLLTMNFNSRYKVKGQGGEGDNTHLHGCILFLFETVDAELNVPAPAVHLSQIFGLLFCLSCHTRGSICMQLAVAAVACGTPSAAFFVLHNASLPPCKQLSPFFGIANPLSF